LKNNGKELQLNGKMCSVIQRECQFGQKTSTIFSMCHLFSVTQYQYQ